MKRSLNWQHSVHHAGIDGGQTYGSSAAWLTRELTFVVVSNRPSASKLPVANVNNVVGAPSIELQLCGLPSVNIFLLPKCCNPAGTRKVNCIQIRTGLVLINSAQASFGARPFQTRCMVP